MGIRQPSVSFVFNRKNYASLTKKASVEIRISWNYQKKYLSTGIQLYSNQWKNGMIVNCPDAVQLSRILTKQLTDIRQVLLDMMEENNIDLSNIQDRISKLKENQIGFIDFCKQRAQIRKYGKAKDTQERYDRFIKYFTLWGRIKTFTDISEMTIIEYDRYLRKSGMKDYSKWNNYHRFLNGFIMDAINAGYIKSNPYDRINIDRGEQASGLDKCLTPDEFRKIRDAIMPTESLSKVRDLFVFQTYTCLRYSDLALFDVDNIKIVNGIRTYMGVSRKTGSKFIVPLLLPALEILDKYNNKLPIISNVKYNLYLKSVAQAAGLDYPLSTHWARHTGATLLLNEGVDMRIVSKICGHSSTRITEQVYAKLLDETIVNAVMDVKDKL